MVAARDVRGSRRSAREQMKVTMMRRVGRQATAACAVPRQGGSSSAQARRRQATSAAPTGPVLNRPRRQGPSVALEAAASEVVEALPEVSDREAVAHLRNLRGSPNKVRRVLDAIRGMSYEEALMALEFMPYRACDDILKVLYSAAANAKHNYGMNKSKLYISRCFCDEGKLIKRPVARARGRSDVRKKPGNHITMCVKERE